jgi:hypothetical protein
MLIATRKLKVLRSDREIDVEVRLFKPIKDDNTWICNYEIDWPGGIKKRHGAGADGIQAIFIAMQMIGISLYTSDHHRNGELAWVTQGGGYGFPVTSSVRDLLVGDDLAL